MIETEHGVFTMVKDFREAFEVKTFNDRYVNYLDKYEFIVGDYSADMLRFKGFDKDSFNTIPDYLIESCTPNAPYYILKRENKK